MWVDSVLVYDHRVHEEIGLFQAVLQLLMYEGRADQFRQKLQLIWMRMQRVCSQIWMTKVCSMHLALGKGFMKYLALLLTYIYVLKLSISNIGYCLCMWKSEQVPHFILYFQSPKHIWDLIVYHTHGVLQDMDSVLWQIPNSYQKQPGFWLTGLMDCGTSIQILPNSWISLHLLIPVKYTTLIACCEDLAIPRICEGYS